MDAGDTIATSLSPEMARVYRNYLLTCRRLGVAPVPRERAHALVAKWSATLEAIKAIEH